MAEKVPVRRIRPGVSGNPKELGPNDPRNVPQFEGEMRSDDQYVSPATIDRPPGPRGYNKGGMVKHGSNTRVTCKGKSS